MSNIFSKKNQKEQAKMENRDTETVCVKDVRGKPVCIRENQLAKLITLRQSSWYILALVIYIMCAMLGFAIAYFVVRLLIYLQLN